MQPKSFYVHPMALCETEDIGEGTRIWAFAHIMKNVHIGANCNIGDHAFIESGAYIGDRVTVKNQALIWEGVHLEDEVFIGPGAIFTNDRYPRSPRMAIPGVASRYSAHQNWLLPIRVCRGATIGAGAVILAGITIGAYAMVAAGAVVTKDVAAHSMVTGTPARPCGLVCYCGKPLEKREGEEWRCTACGPCSL